MEKVVGRNLYVGLVFDEVVGGDWWVELCRIKLWVGLGWD